MMGANRLDLPLDAVPSRHRTNLNDNHDLSMDRIAA